MDNIDSTKRLAAAVVVQAIWDWRALCRGKKPPTANFKELERFFKYDCEMYLHGTGINAEKLYQQMMVERARSSKHKREG